MELTLSQKEILLANSYNYDCLIDESRGDSFCKFKKGNIIIWYSSSCKWIKALVIDGFHFSHEKFNDLETALKDNLC